MADGKVVYQIVGDSKGLSGDMTKAEGVIRSSVGSWDGIVSDAVAGIGAAFAAAVAAGGAALAALGKQGVEYNAEMEKFQTGFTTLLGDEQKAADLMEQIKSDAAVTPFDVAGLTQAVQLLVSADINAADARTTILALGDAIAATGGGDDELARMAQNLQQVSNTGKATAVDVKQFAMAGINIYKVLADYLGVTAKEAAEMEVTFDMLQGALVAAASEGGRYFGAMADQSETFNGAVSNLGDSFGQFSGRVTEGLSKAAVGLVTTLSDMLNSMSPFEEAITAVFDAIADGVTQRLPLIQSAFETLGTAVGQILPKISEMREYLPDISDAMTLIAPAAEQLKNVIPVLSESVNALLTPLKGISTEALPTAREEFANLLTVLSELTADILPVLAGFVGELLASVTQLGINILPSLLGTVSTLLKPLGEMVKDVLPALSAVIDAILPVLEKIFKNVVEPIAGAIAKIFPMLSEIAKILLGKIADLVERIRPGLEQLTEKLAPLIEKTGDFITKIGELITLALEPVAELIETVVAVAFEDFIGKLDNLLTVLGEIADFIYEQIILAVEDFQAAVKTLSEFLVKIFKGDVKGAFETLEEAARGASERAQKKLESFVEFVKGIPGKIKNALSGLKDTVSDAIDDVKSFFTGDTEESSGVTSGGSYTASAAHSTSSGVTVGGGGGKFGSTTINTTVELDGRVVGQSTMTHLDDTASTTVGGN